MSSSVYKIAVLGGGAFGTALAHISSRNQGNFVKIYARNQDVVNSINSKNLNPKFFPDTKFS